MKSDYGHLTISAPSAKGKLPTHVGFKYWVRKSLASNNYTYRVVRRVLRSLQSLEYIRNVHLRTYETLTAESEDAGEFGSSYGYPDELAELACGIKYKKQLDDGLEDSSTESGGLYKHIEHAVTRLLEEDKTIKHVVNFGVSYAYIDSLLAEFQPDVRFVGIDRSRFTKLLNEDCFGHIKNLEFLAGDFFQLATENNYSGAVFLHARTLLLLPKSFLQRLYKHVRESGFKYVLAIEQVGMSRQTFRPYQFSDDDQPSIVYRDAMFIHNYPGLLAEAGFEVVRSELVKTNHPHEDYRFLSIVARVNGSEID